MYSREQIIEELKRVAAKLGTTNLKETDFELNSTVPMSTVRFYLGSWHRALQEAGLDYGPPADKKKSDPHAAPKKNKPGSDEELLKELLRLHEDSGQVPTLALIQEKSQFSDRHYRDRWRSIAEAFDLAQQKYSPKKVAPTLQKFQLDKETLLEKESSPTVSPEPASEPVPDTDHQQEWEPHPTTSQPETAPVEIPVETHPGKFRGLQLPPGGKQGVIFLFGMIAAQLGFIVEVFKEDGPYPYAEGKRSAGGQQDNWYPVCLRFEYKSSQYKSELDAPPPPSRDDGREILVCWEHDEKEAMFEVLELKTTVKELQDLE